MAWCVACAGAPREASEPEPIGTVEIASAPQHDDSDEPLPTDGDKPGRHRVGRRVLAQGYAFTVADVKRCQPRPEYSAPPKDRVWLGVKFEIEAESTAVWANPNSAWVTDATGEKYRYVYVYTQDCEPRLYARQLQPGVSAEGWIVFDVPEGARRLTFNYDQPVDGESQVMEVDLGM